MPENPSAGTEELKPKKPLKTILVITGVLAMEAGTIGIFMAKNDPKPAAATDPIEATQDNASSSMAEITLADAFDVDNWTSGRARTLVTLEVAAKVKKDNRDKLGLLVEEHKTEIMDRIRSLVASALPDHIRDPKLQVIKRDIKASLEQIVGEGLIEDIFLPTWQSCTIE